VSRPKRKCYRQFLCGIWRFCCDRLGDDAWPALGQREKHGPWLGALSIENQLSLTWPFAPKLGPKPLQWCFMHPINTELSPEFPTQRRAGLAPTTVANKQHSMSKDRAQAAEKRRGFCFLGGRATNAKNRTNDGSNITAQPSKQGTSPKSVTDFTVFHRGTLPTIHASLATPRVASAGIQAMVSVLLAGPSTATVAWGLRFREDDDAGCEGPCRCHSAVKHHAESHLRQRLV
jgi:hypothetical protein